MGDNWAMLKLALQHFVLENCISVLFDNVISNFGGNCKFNVGDRISYMKLFYWDDTSKETFIAEVYGVKVIDISGDTYTVEYDRLFTGELHIEDGERYDKIVEHDGKKYYCTEHDKDDDFYYFAGKSVISHRK